MTEHTNPATRIFNLVHEVLANTGSFAASSSATDGWAKVLDVQQPVKAMVPFDVALRLVEAHSEVLLLKKALGEATRIRPHVYQNTLIQLSNLLSPMHLAALWSTVKSTISPDTMNLLETFQASLPLSYEELEISREELIAIRKIADDLILSLESSAMSEPVREFIQRQADMILRALDLYPIQGVRALREAQRGAMGDVIENNEMVRENELRPEMKEVASAWKRIAGACNIARGVDAAIRIGKEVWELIESAPNA